MKTKILILLALTALITSCTKSKFNYVDSTTQGSYRIDLYSMNENADESSFLEFCKSKKPNYSTKSFYLILFDKEQNATFPKHPITGLYGSEPEKMKHIKGYYIFISINGYSKMTYYRKNSLESKPINYDI